MTCCNRFPTTGHKRAIHKLTRLLLLLRADEDASKRARFDRACGDTICDRCGCEYREHVDDPVEPWLTVLCSGERVKL